jgi:hypothetical protein
MAAWMSVTVIWAEASETTMPKKRIEATSVPIKEYIRFRFMVTSSLYQQTW